MKEHLKPFCVVRDDGWIYSFNKTRELAEKVVRDLVKFSKSTYRVEQSPGAPDRWFK